MSIHTPHIQSNDTEVEPQKIGILDLILALIKAIFDAIKELLGFE